MAQIKCKECSKSVEESESRMWKGERICRPCYKGHKKERKLQNLAKGF